MVCVAFQRQHLVMQCLASRESVWIHLEPESIYDDSSHLRAETFRSTLDERLFLCVCAFMVPSNGLAYHPKFIFMPSLYRIKKCLLKIDEYGNFLDRQSALLNEFAKMNDEYYDICRFSHSATGLELNQHQFIESHFLEREVS